jgi:PAS domain S-box-containing protein
MLLHHGVAKKRTLALGVALTVFFFGKICYDIQTDHQLAISTAEQHAKGLASALNEHALRTFSDTEGTIDSMSRSITAVFAAGLPNEKTLQHVFIEQKRSGSVLATQFVANPQGFLLGISSQYPVRPIPVADREYFQHHLHSTDPSLFISKPFRDRLNNEWLITATKRLSNPNGTLRMIVGVSIRTRYFSSFYSTLALEPRDRILLIRRDGTILSLEPFSEKTLQTNFVNTRLFQRELKRAPESGTYQVEKTPLDGTDRIVSYRSSAAYPVIAIISLDKVGQLHPWRIRALKEVAGAGLFAALVATLAFLIRSQLASLKQANLHLSRNQHELSDAKRRSQEIVNSIDGIVWEFDLTLFRFSFVSERCETITGFPSADWLSDPLFWSRRIHPGDPSWAGWLPPGVSGIPEDASFEYRFRKKDGSFLWLRDIVSVVNEGGHATRLRGVMLDISQAKQAEAALLEYQKAIECSGDMVSVVDREYRYLVANRACLDHLQLERNELIGRPLTEVLGRDRFLELKPFLDACLDGQPVSFRLQLLSPEGESRENSISLSPVEDSGIVSRVACVARDTTESRRAEQAQGAAEEALRLSEQRFRELLENIHLASMILDTEGKVTFCNDFLLQLTGWSREEAMGADWCDHFLPPEGRERMRALFAAGFAQGEIPAHHENPIVTRDGEQRIVSWDNTVLHNTDGTLAGIASIGMDLTQHRALEEQLRQSQKMEATGLLAGGIAHDFNNILTVIIGYCSIMQMRMEQEDANRASVDQVLAAAERAAGLTRSLLAFSRKQVMNPHQVDLNAIVRHVEHFLRRVIGEDITLSSELYGEELYVLADSSQIEQILMNLATNARDAMPNGGTLSISTQVVELDPVMAGSGCCTPGRYALLTVSDNGTGMDEKTRGKIFEPFFTTKEVGKGTGLGLAMAYGTVMQHSGQITVESEPGRGTTFKVYLPRVAYQTPVPRQEASPFVLHAGHELILVAEDEPAVRELVEGILVKFGYRVLLACDGEDAVAKFREHRDEIDLVLLDMIMPKLSGKAAYDEITRIKPGVRAIFTSGYTADVISSKGELGPGMELVMKPAHPLLLLRKVREKLDCC